MALLQIIDLECMFVAEGVRGARYWIICAAAMQGPNHAMKAAFN
jgi:hypothetical protein